MSLTWLLGSRPATVIGETDRLHRGERDEEGRSGHTDPGRPDPHWLCDEAEAGQTSSMGEETIGLGHEGHLQTTKT